MTVTVPLQQLRKNSILTAGGKGANLGEMMAAGIPVPAGFVLTTDAYEVFVNENGLQQQIMDLASRVSAGKPRLSEAASTAIKGLFLGAAMPESIQADLLESYAGLTAEAADGVAVRSSTTAEDLPSASFAGQQETFLNVRGHEALLQAVKECWAGLWTARALAYRERMGIDHETAAIAVIVQTMVPAEISGILFTANPASGARDEMVVNASYGLGEAVVSGQVTPDTIVLARERMTIKETTPGTKEMIIVSGAEQGTTTRLVPEAQRVQLALSPEQLNELAALGVRVEEQFNGVPQDIEWAVVAGKCWILQARPITNLPPAPLRDVRWEPLRPGSVWMRRQVVEHIPDPLSPLFDELYLQEGLDQSMEELARYMGDLSGVKIDIWEFIQPPFAATINGYAYSIASFEMSWKHFLFALQIYVKVLPQMIRQLVPRWRDETLPAYRATIAQWKGIDLTSATDEDLLRGVRELSAEDAVYWFAAAVPLGLARTTDAALDHFLKLVKTGRDGVRLTSGSFLRGFPSKTAEAQAQLETIARKIQTSATLREQVAAVPAARLPDMLAEHPDGQNVLDDLQHYLDTYGHQIYNLDFAVPTLADDPLPVLLSLKASVANPEQDSRAHQVQLAQERETLVANTERSLDPIRRWIFRLLLGWAVRYSPYREEALFYVGAAWPALRRLALELGLRLTEAGSLDTPDDVFYLRSAELASAGAARAEDLSRPDLAQLAHERRILREARKRLEPPVTVPQDGRMKFGPIDMAMFEPKPRSISSGPTLEGFAVSPGSVTAPASVIHSPDDFDKMLPDTILVCTTTTPAWTPLFAQAQGLVTDIGGALAHGSIVAREYGIPAVMGTGVATQRIANGQRIRVDGDTGTVTLLDEIETGTVDEAKAEETGSSARKYALAALAGGLLIGLLLWWKKRR